MLYTTGLRRKVVQKLMYYVCVILLLRVFSGFSVQRELYSPLLKGIPELQV